MNNSDVLLDVKDLKIYFWTQRGIVRGVDGVDFSIKKGKSLGVIGETGSGKTLAFHAVMGLIDGFPGVISGDMIWHNDGTSINLLSHLKDTIRIEYKEYPENEKIMTDKRMMDCNDNPSDGPSSANEAHMAENVQIPGNNGNILYIEKDINRWNGALERNYRNLRGDELGIIFQDPQTSLNPYWTIGSQFQEVILRRKKKRVVNKNIAKGEALEWLKRLRIHRPEKVFDSYPHQLSGGMCQRAMIGLALSSFPQLLIADEPTTGLDVTIQARIVELLKEIRDEYSLTLSVISHDLHMVSHLTDEIIVMYSGLIVESGPKDIVLLGKDLSNNHPYTEGLIESLPNLERQREKKPLKVIEGDVPDPANLPEGCRFHPRCPVYHMPEFKHLEGCCTRRLPPLIEVSEGHKIRCWKFLKELRKKETGNE